MTYPCCSGTEGHAKWCISTPRMLAGESVTYTPAVRHVVTYDVITEGPTNYFRWHCSCGKTGRWVTRRLQAQQGGTTHQRRAS